MQEQIEKIRSNIRDIIDAIDMFDKICTDALELNNDTSYKEPIKDMKYSLQIQRNKLKSIVLEDLN